VNGSTGRSKSGFMKYAEGEEAPPITHSHPVAVLIYSPRSTVHAYDTEAFIRVHNIESLN
jgi:hypothetical protein